MGKREDLREGFLVVSWNKLVMETDERLEAAAQFRAEDMAERGYFGHVDPDGYWPNYYVRDHGYMLPSEWPDDSNQVESIARGFLDPRDAVAALVASPDHHDHVVGNGFWVDHTRYGVGYAERDGDTYCVIVTAPREDAPTPNTHTIYLPYVSARNGVRP